MKPVLAVLLIVLFVIVASASNKRYYDAWDSSNDLSSSGSDDIIRIFPFRQKSSKKEDPCANKPLWYLKYQARLGKLSPFYDCLSMRGI